MNEQARMNNQEIASFFSQTALLFQAGIAPRDSMMIMLKDCKTESGKELLQQIIKVCMQGESFHTALESTEVFPDYVINMVTLGEESGNLDSCMLSLADYYEKEESISESVRSALTYPIIMILMMLVVIVVLISKVMPIFQQVYVELGSEMTGFAASLLSIGSTLDRYSILLLVILVVLVALYLLSRHTEKGRAISHNFLVRFPLTKGFFESVACQRFASGLAIAISSGMDTYSGLDMVEKMVEHAPMEEKIRKCRDFLNQGENFSDALTNSQIFTSLYAQMIAVGFKSGNIDVVLSRIADNYEKETNKRIAGILAVLEPTLVIILSVIVGMILLSVILPLIGIMSSIG